MLDAADLSQRLRNEMSFLRFFGIQLGSYRYIQLYVFIVQWLQVRATHRYLYSYKATSLMMSRDVRWRDETSIFPVLSSVSGVVTELVAAESIRSHATRRCCARERGRAHVNNSRSPYRTHRVSSVALERRTGRLMSSGRSPLLSSIAVLSGPVTLYLRSDDESSAQPDRSVWSAAGVFASLVETATALDFNIYLGCAFVLCCVITKLLYEYITKAVNPNTSTAVPPVRGEAVVVLDCTASDGNRRGWPIIFAKHKLIHHIEVNSVGELTNLSANLEEALPQGDVGAVVVVEPWSLFQASQVSSFDQIGVSRYLENTLRGLRRFADSHGVTTDHDVPIPVLGCSAEYGLLQLSRSSMCGFFAPTWVHTEDDSLLGGNRPVPDAAQIALQAVANEWQRDQQLSTEKNEKAAKQAIKREEKKSKKKTL